MTRIPRLAPTELTNTQSSGFIPTWSINAFGNVTCSTSVTIRGRSGSRSPAEIGSSGGGAGINSSAHRRSLANVTLSQLFGRIPDNDAISVGRPIRRFPVTRREISIVLKIALLCLHSSACSEDSRGCI
jgi:hypothetical protein